MKMIIDPDRCRCNNCYNIWYEDELQLLRDGDEWYKGCPVCKTDEYLTDIEVSQSKKPRTYPRKRVKVGRKTMYLPDDGKGHVPKAYLKDVNSKRSTRSLAQDNIHRASMTYPSPTPRYMAANWIRHPNKYDIEGIDAPKMSRQDEIAYASDLARTYRDYSESEEDLAYLEDSGYEDVGRDHFWKGNRRRASQEREKREWFWQKASEEDTYNRSFNHRGNHK